MNQNAFTLFQFAALEHIGPNGEKILGQCGCLQHGIARGNGQSLPLWHGGVFCVCAAIGEGANLVANLPFCGTLAQCNHFARDFQTHNG